MEMAGKVCEIRTVENDSKSVDEVAMETVEMDMGTQKPYPRSQSPTLCGRHSNYNEEPKTPEKLVLKGSNICDDFNYTTTSKSVGGRAPSKSTSRHRPETPEIERRSSVKRRLVFPDMGTSSASNPTMPQKSPSLFGPSLGGFPRPSICFTGNKKTDEINPSSVGDLRNKPSPVGDLRNKPSPVGDLRKWLR